MNFFPIQPTTCRTCGDPLLFVKTTKNSAADSHMCSRCLASSFKQFPGLFADFTRDLGLVWIQHLEAGLAAG